jgi:bacterioferritin-associated ferredoxin
VYVCLCNAVTDDEVVEAVDAGATTVAAVGDSTRAGTCCTMCHDTIEDVIEERCGVCPLAAKKVAQVA